MSAATTDKTRWEDWHDRRQYLESLCNKSHQRVAEIKVLDYLISRYHDAELAQRPARFALQTGIYWNDRGIIVHQHLAQGLVAGVQSREQAEQRIKKLVCRMASGKPHERSGFTPTKIKAVRSFWWRRQARPTWRLKLGWNADRQIQSTLADYPILSRVCIEHLLSRITDLKREDRVALNLFLQCENPNIIFYTVRAWRDRVAQGSSAGLITEELAARILCSEYQPHAAEMIREKLADDNPQVRIAAYRLLAKIRDLDDIGLLSDLLALPEASDGDSRERAEIIAAMRAIAERNAETKTS